MIITNLNPDTLEEKSVELGDDKYSNDKMIEHLLFKTWSNSLYINWDKHKLSKDINEIL